MKVKIIVAVDSYFGFAKDNNIPWNIPEDFKHFMDTTSDSYCITGKKSFLEMVELKKAKLGPKYDPDAPVLKDRDTFVLSRSLDPRRKDASVINNIHETIEALKAEAKYNNIFILGGRDVYIEAMPLVDELIITEVAGDYECDRIFPHKFIDQFQCKRIQPLKTKTHGSLNVFYYKRISS